MRIITDEWDAKDYKNNSSAQESWADELIKKLSLYGNEHLLDIGCGDGKITNKLSVILKYGKVVGIDNSLSMIELAKIHYKNYNLSFYKMDAANISLKEKFDIGFSNAALHWVKDHKKVLISLKKHLKDNARILFQMGGRGNANELLDVIKKVTTSAKWVGYFKKFKFPYSFYDVEDYEKWLGLTGYNSTRIELIKKNMIHENIDRFRGWLRTTFFPYTNQLPEKDKEIFLDNLIEEYIKEFPLDNEGRTKVKMVRLEVEAYVK